MRIIVLCTANTCRSPMAEAMLQKKLGERAEVISRGLMMTGAGASEESIEVMREMGMNPMVDNFSIKVHVRYDD